MMAAVSLGVVSAVLPLVTIVTLIRNRKQRKSGGEKPVDETLEARRAATRETERRMAAYLASRDQR